MGGFHFFKRSDEQDGPDVPFHPLHVITVLELLESRDIERPTEEEIQDKSKSDSLAKAVVLIQTGWFILQCLARWAEHLPTTQLEITTLAYTAVNIGICLAWWDKPRNVNQPIRVKVRPWKREVLLLIIQRHIFATTNQVNVAHSNSPASS